MSTAGRREGNAWSRAFSSARGRVHRLPGGETVWRVGIAVLGLLIVVTGVILLPLPGPGWLIIFLGLGVWATEFAWAERLLRRARTFLGRWTSWVLARPRWLQSVVGAGGLAVIGLVAVAGWFLVWDN